MHWTAATKSTGTARNTMPRIVRLRGHAGRVLLAFLSLILGSLASASGAAPRPDFDGNGTTDLIWRNSASGQTVVWLMNGTSASSSAFIMNDPTWVVAASGDFNGDGKTDLVWRNSATGQTVIWLMNGTSASASAFIMNDPTWVVTATGDFDGDGKTDLVWRNSTSGQTVVWLMNGASPSAS